MNKTTLFLITLLLSSLTMAQTLTPITVILDWFPNPDHAPLFVAQQQGFFRDAGLSVKLIGPSDTADPPKMIAAGKAEIGIVYEPQLMIDISRGLPLMRIGTLIGTPLDMLLVRKDSGIHVLADLKGKRIGYSTEGLGHVMLRAMLAKAGLTLKDVQLINVHYGLTQALLGKNIDAATGMMRNFELPQFMLQHVAVKAFYPEENGMPNYDELLFAVNPKNAHAPWVQPFLSAVERGVIYLLNHPAESWAQFAKVYPENNNALNHLAWEKTLPRFALHPALYDKTEYQKLADFLVAEGVIKQAVTVEAYR